jgi:hypothetical protein
VKEKARNKGTPYELMTKEIFQFLVNQDSVRNITVIHNTVLLGKTTKHQIDIYWEFELGGITYATVVQAKNWEKTVDQGELLKFKGVLDDLPGQPRGIVVSASGYQSGAEEVAAANGILLFQLFEEPPKEITVTVGSFAKFRIAKKTPSGIKDLNDPDARIQPGVLVFEIIVFDPVFSDGTFQYDVSWLQEQKKRIGDRVVTEMVSQRIEGLPHEIGFYDESGNTTGNLQKIYTSFVEEMREKEIVSNRMLHRFSAPTFLKVSSQALPYIKIDGLSSYVTLEPRAPHISYAKAKEMVNYILRNLTSGEEKVFRVKNKS